jgi:hypothetical protein
MLRRLLALQACCLATALAQPIDARDELFHPVNPPVRIPSYKNSPAQAFQKTAPVPAEPVFKIDDVEFDETDPKEKKLSLGISHMTAQKPNPADVRVMCIFYDADANGYLSPTVSKITTEWITAPVDWSDAENEQLILRYQVLDSDKKYAGYSIGIYYNDELQDSRASSPDILKAFPLPDSSKKSTTPLDESGRFQSAYRSFQRAEKCYTNGEQEKAREAIQKAIAQLSELQRDYPSWQPKLVDFRLAAARLLAAKIEEE